MINTWLLYLHKASLLALLCFVILGTISCSKALYYQDSFCIAPILRDEKVARLSADEQAVVRYLVHRLFEANEARGRYYEKEVYLLHTGIWQKSGLQHYSWPRRSKSKDKASFCGHVALQYVFRPDLPP